MPCYVCKAEAKEHFFAYGAQTPTCAETITVIPMCKKCLMKALNHAENIAGQLKHEEKERDPFE